VIPIPDGVSIGSFACVAGDVEGKPTEVPDFDEIWAAQAPNSDFATMGCDRYWKMSGPLERYVVACVRQTLAYHATPPTSVDQVVFATTDACLALLGDDFAVNVLAELGMDSCVPAVMSLQQCCGSVTALRYGWDQFADDDVSNVVLVSFGYTPADSDRIRSFAFFGDAVASCLISRTYPGTLRLTSSAINVDYLGLVGQDSFVSRQAVARRSLEKVLRAPGVALDDVTKVFPTNLYRPLTLFSAAAAGVDPGALHFVDTLAAYAHCGNSDWMINLIDYDRTVGVRTGENYLVQASAPGFFACGLLVAT
jgi:3-oxoacyl-[acyl-carrier-protein] synthase III